MTLVLYGISTNIGVESAPRFAYEYGYNQIFVEDALLAEEHRATVTKIFRRIAWWEKPMKHSSAFLECSIEPL